MAGEIEKIKKTGDYSDPYDLARKNKALLNVAKEVYLALLDDGRQVLGEDLWGRFEAEYKDA